MIRKFKRRGEKEKNTQQSSKKTHHWGGLDDGCDGAVAVMTVAAAVTMGAAEREGGGVRDERQ